MLKQERKPQSVRTIGEPFVWMTAMGLGLGLLMVIFLLLLILRNGFEVFWPDRVMQLKLKQESQAKLGESLYIGGRLVEEQKKAAADQIEWQIFTGNK